MNWHALVPIHGLRNIATLAALAVSPFAIWYIKRRVDRWEESLRRDRARRSALDVAVTVAKAIQLCETVRLALQSAARLPDDTLEAAAESLDVLRQTLRLYLSRHIPLHELIPLAADAEKRLGQGHQAMLALQAPPGAPPLPGALYADQLEIARAELAQVVERLRGLQPDLGRAIAKVDAGWALLD